MCIVQIVFLEMIGKSQTEKVERFCFFSLQKIKTSTSHRKVLLPESLRLRLKLRIDLFIEERFPRIDSIYDEHNPKGKYIKKYTLVDGECRLVQENNAQVGTDVKPQIMHAKK